jgi:amino-acid N-acetyltransferase
MESSISTVEQIPASCPAEMSIRKAGMRDIPELLRLVNGYASQGIMLPRTEFEIAENLRDFIVVQTGERLAGCAALHFYTATTAEVRSLAVAPEFKGWGAGRLVIESLEAEAQTFGLQSVFAFTYIPDFFRRLGYSEIERGDLPLKAWKDCLRCPKFQCCDETAVIKRLTATQMQVETTHISGGGNPRTSAGDPLVQLPVLKKSH